MKQFLFTLAGIMMFASSFSYAQRTYQTISSDPSKVNEQKNRLPWEYNLEN